MTKPRIFVTGIDTNAGKTVCAATLVAGLAADYWKPVQTGTDQGDNDTDWVRAAVQPFAVRTHPEAWALGIPQSPHWAARHAGVEIRSQDLHVPTTPNTLVIEGAGGLLVPLNERELYIDAVQAWQVPVVLVVRLYLGCINHSLLSLEALRTRNLPLLGVVFNGEPQPEVEAAILEFSGAHYIGHLPHLPQPDFASLQAVFRSWAWPLAQE